MSKKKPLVNKRTFDFNKIKDPFDCSCEGSCDCSKGKTSEKIMELINDDKKDDTFFSPNKKENVFHATCECYCSVLRMEVEDDSEFNKEDKVSPPQIIMSVYYHNPSKRSWKNKWDNIKNILKTGRPFEDQFCLSRDDAIKLKDWLKRIK